MRIGSWAWLVIGLCCGCGGGAADGVSYAKVAGVVLLGGKPIEGATVTFIPQKKGAMSMAITDADGRFTLETVSGRPGAAVGDHDVTVTLSKTFGTPAPAAAAPTGTDPLLSPPQPGEANYVAPPAAPQTRWIVPERYSKPGALKATVPPAGIPEHKIELTN